ncbi:MAG TPA: mechanosensitive ion channel domain-containing protein [Alphaproteobacteria bacterium]|nr:mechanosensitive ion channel domain-containing protein [Alphaproteobacteria bacterium]
MQNLLDTESILSMLRAIEAWVFANVLVYSNLGQIAAVAATFFAARYLGPMAKAGLARLSLRLERRFADTALALRPLAVPAIWLLLQWLAVLVAADAQWPHQLVKVAASLLTAWVIIRLTSNLVRDPVWSRIVAVIAWSIAALNILNLLDPTIALLNAVAVNLGGLRISALSVIRGMISLAVLLWLAITASRLLERRITALPNLTPSVQVLFVKLLKVVLVIIAVVAALRSIGIDLTAFAVFSGAVGVGIGFGLQKAVSNLISGITLLLDKSIKPGDVIAVGGTYGWVQSLGARYVSVVTRDGIEHLIPNEELITQRVENWSYSSDLLRLRVPVGISYHADVRQAMALALEAVRGVPRVLATPEPGCLLTGFGASAIELELRFWIKDPANGVANVKSAVLLGVWDGFRAAGIEMPYPQRDLHLRSPAAIQVSLTGGGPLDRALVPEARPA